MRAGACTIQQTLTAEAASVLKHSLNLARRRGHAQATPLHVAATLLSSRTSLLRNACLKSHPHSSSHPLQCRALELCFNVALNRLPTTPGPLFHGQHSLSNALIAAVKRAQAHQRRGCIEQQQQQQPLLAIKVELEQLVISILDDPSVSRVMREAGFSSTCVKNNLEVSSSSSSSILQCYSSNGLIGSLHFPTESRMEVINHGDFRPTYFVNSYSEKNSVLFPSQKKNFVSVLEDSNSDNEDFRLVLDVLMKKKKNTVIVGDYSSDTEGLVLEFMRKIEKGEVPEGLRAVKFVKFIVSLVTLKFMKRDDVEKNIANLRKQVNSLVFTGGAVIYVGDLKWTVEEAVAEKNETSLTENMSDYSSVSHMIQEISKIISDFSNFTSKVWLMATANYQTLMKCQMKQPPLETQWAFQAVQVPSGGLALSLHYSSDIGSRVEILQNPSEVKPNEEQDKLMCCSECTSNFEKEAGVSISTSFTSWLHYNTSENKPKDVLLELKRKWNRFCHVLHRPRGSNIPLKSSLFNHTSRSSTYPFFSASLKYNHNDTSTINKSMAFSDTDLNPKSHFDFISSFRNYDSTNEFTVSGGNFRYSDNQKYQSTELSLSSLKKSENKDKVFLALGNSLFSESPTSIKRNWSESQDLCQELQENIPWQAETIRMITQILPNFNKSWKGGTWLLLQGNDWIGKRRLARAMAELYCGSSTQLLRITTEMINENENSCIDSLFEILKGGKMCVILIENVDFMDTHLLALLEHGFKTGDIEDPNGKPTELSQAIFILSTGIFKDSEQDLVIQMKLYVDDQTKQISDSKNRKRAAESDLSNSQKFLKTDEKEWSILMNTEKKVLRLSIPKDLDLNIQVEEEDHNLDESNAVSSDLTQESSIGFHSNKRFIDMIKNKFVFEQNPYQIVHMKEIFLSKMRNSLHELGEIETEDDFFVDQTLLKELVYSSPSFLIQLFEKWLKDVLQTSFKTVKNGGKNSTLRLSLDLQGAKEAKLSEFGFGGSCLPKRIHSEN